jgi:hypothetical protein
VPIAKVSLQLNIPGINQVGMREARKLVADATRAVYNRGNILTPVDTGLLRASNNLRLWENALVVYGEVFNRLDYAPPVHNGSRQHTIVPKKKGGRLRFIVNGQVVFAKSAVIPARKGRPWLTQAMLQVAPQYGFKIVDL